MIRPTIENIVEIIEKLKTLKEKLSDFINEKYKVPNDKPVDTPFDELSIDDEIDKAVSNITGRPVRSIEPQNYTEKLSAEQLLKLLIGCDSSIPTEIKQKIPANEKHSKFLGMHPEQLFEKKLRQSSIVKLHRLLNEVIPKLLEDDEILSNQKQQLHQIKNSVSRKLKRNEKVKDGVAKAIEAGNRADLHRRQREGDWPKDIKQLTNEIDMLLYPYLDYLKEKGNSVKWEQAFVEYIIKAGMPSKLDDVIQELKKVKYKMEIESQQLSPKKTAETKRNKKKTKKAEKPEKRFQPWTNSGDACFIIENDRIKFHYQDQIKDLKLKKDSHTLDLLVLLSSGSLLPSEIQDKICPDTKNKASKIVNYANKLLNETITKLGFINIPSNVEYIERDEFNSYRFSYKMHTKEDFEQLQREEPLEDNRGREALDDADESYR